RQFGRAAAVAVALQVAGRRSQVAGRRSEVGGRRSGRSAWFPEVACEDLQWLQLPVGGELPELCACSGRRQVADGFDLFGGHAAEALDGVEHARRVVVRGLSAGGEGGVAVLLV